MNRDKCTTDHHPVEVPLNGGDPATFCANCFTRLPSPTMSYPPIPTLKPAPPMTGHTDRVILFNRRMLCDRLSPRISRHRATRGDVVYLFPLGRD